MALASTRTVILGTFAFLVFWILATFPSFPVLPIGRTAGAVLAAALMVIFRVDTPEEAYAAINLPILGLLFGTMVVSVYLERADMFEYLANLLSWKCKGGKDLLCRLSFLIAVSSAIFTNDTCCVVFTEFVLKLCRENNLPPEPFLIALASSANLGSSATPIGNPQNLIIAVESKITFLRFVIGIAPAMLVGVAVNTTILLLIYWKQLSGIELRNDRAKKDLSEATKDQLEEEAPDLENARSSKSILDKADILESCLSMDSDDNKIQACHLERLDDSAKNSDMDDAVPDTQAHGSKNLKECTLDGITDGNHYKQQNRTFQAENAGSIQMLRVSLGSKSERESPSAVSSRSSPVRCESLLQISEEKDISAAQKRKRIVWKISVYLVAFGMLVALLAGLNLSWSALSAAIALMVLDFTDAGPSIYKVSYSLLVFFSGMFITVDGFNRTGLPESLWTAIEPHARINHGSGVAVLTAMIIFLSNVASNVPTVLLLGPRVAESSAALPGASVTKSWLMLAWASTVAGNLTLVGSAANLIVCEKARTAPYLPYHLPFWRHLRFGFPVTLLIAALGIPMIR